MENTRRNSIHLYVRLLGLGFVWLTQSAFTSGGAIPVAQGPRWVAAGDFDLDGDQDLAVVSRPARLLSIFLGDGAGGFTLNSTLSTGANPNSISIADFSSDGIPDLVVTNRSSNTISVFLGVGDGTFTVDNTYAVGTGPRTSVTADFNGDTHTDIGVVHRISHDVYIFLNTGTGSFILDNIFSPGKFPRQAAAGDFNGDQKVDLGVTVAGRKINTVAGKVFAFAGTGDGSFVQRDNDTTGFSVVSVAAGHFDDGDGILDLVAANLGIQADPINTSSVAVLKGNGNGTFTNTVPAEVRVAQGPRQVITADLDNDGTLDIATANERSDTVTVLLADGNGNGQFNTRVDLNRGLGIGSGPQSLAAVDVNGDGLLDLAVTNLCSTFVSLLINDGNFTPPSPPPVDPDPNTFDLCIEGSIQRKF